MEPQPLQEVNVSRYLRFVIVFLLIMFSALGAYEYYYGTQARKAQEMQQQFDRTAAAEGAATSTYGGR